MLWIGLAGPMAVVHARSLDGVANAVAKLKQQSQHIAEHAEHGHNGGVAHSHNDVPAGDPDCLKFCAELLDTPGVLTLPAELPEMDSGKSLAQELAALYPSKIFALMASSASATGPPRDQGFCQRHCSGLQALLTRNHRLRI